jgi:regulatory protein
MKITSVEKNKKQHNMLAVFIDNEFSFCIPEDIYLKLGLYEDRELNGDEILEIKRDIISACARECAVKFIQIKIRSVNDVREKLRFEGYDRELVEMVLEDLIALGYLNDRLYARKYVFDRKILKPKSKRMLRHELMSRGIDEEIIDDVLSELKIDDVTTAEGLVKRKFGKYDFNDEKLIRRIYYFLRQRGYGDEVIEEVIKKML